MNSAGTHTTLCTSKKYYQVLLYVQSQHLADQFNYSTLTPLVPTTPSLLPWPRSTDPPATQGLFLAPTIVGESLKGAFLLAEVFGGTFGLPTNPPPPSIQPPAALGGDDGEIDILLGAGSTPGVPGIGGGNRSDGVGGRTDIVQALQLGDRDRLVKFCEAVQLFSPVNAYVRPGEYSYLSSISYPSRETRVLVYLRWLISLLYSSTFAIFPLLVSYWHL